MDAHPPDGLFRRAVGLTQVPQFHRQRKKRKAAGGESYNHRRLCETVRTAKGRRQRVVAGSGKLDEKDIRSGGWDDIESLLSGKRWIGRRRPASWWRHGFARRAANWRLPRDGMRTALEDLLGVDKERINNVRLYPGLDTCRKVLPPKNFLFSKSFSATPFLLHFHKQTCSFHREF